MGDDQMVPQEVHEQDGMFELEDMQWPPVCTHMATSDDDDDDDEQLASGARTHVHTDDHESPACTHMSTSEDECSQKARVQDFYTMPRSTLRKASCRRPPQMSPRLGQSLCAGDGHEHSVRARPCRSTAQALIFVESKRNSGTDSASEWSTSKIAGPLTHAGLPL